MQDVGAWVSHPGGPKIIEAIEDELGVGPQALEMTWLSLAEVGNLSSALGAACAAGHAARPAAAARSARGC